MNCVGYVVVGFNMYIALACMGRRELGVNLECGVEPIESFRHRAFDIRLARSVCNATIENVYVYVDVDVDVGNGQRCCVLRWAIARNRVAALA